MTWQPHMLTDLEREAFEGVHQFAQRGLVFLVDGPIGPSMHRAANGSGTLLRTPLGRIVVLTARHVLEDDRPSEFAIAGRSQPEGLDDAVGREWWHPDVDVAVALLKQHAASVLGTHAVSSDVVAETGDATIGGHQAALICGFPASYRDSEVDHHARRVEVNFPSVSYLTLADGIDAKGRHRVQWGEGVVGDRDRPGLRGVAPGELFNLAHPGGMSGGPLWRFTKVPKGEVWDPSKMARIIGVASSYLAPHEFAPSVATWGDWFRETIAEIDTAP